MKTLATLAVLALSAINLTAQNNVVVHGTVYFNGQPVPNVSVYLFQANPFPGCLNCGGPRDIDGFLRCYAGNQDVQCLLISAVLRLWPSPTRKEATSLD